MNFLTYLGHLIQYAFWNPNNPALSVIAWVAFVWGLFIVVVPRTNKLRHLQQPLRKINNTWRVLILVLLILSSVIVAAYNYVQNRPIVILSQNGMIFDDNTTVTINFYIENIGVNTAYNINPRVSWAPESKPQDLSSPGIAVTVFYLHSGEQSVLPLKLDRNYFLGNFIGNDGDRWYIYYTLEYSDAPSKGTEYTEQYSYLLDLSTRSLSALPQTPAFQPYTSSK